MCNDTRFIIGLDKELQEKIENQLRDCYRHARTMCHTDTPYTTVIHRDLWSTNFMIKKGIFI